MYKTKTQIKLGGTPRQAKETSHAGATSHHHPPSRSGGTGSTGEKFTINIFQAVKGPAEPVVDDMTYRKSARIIVTIDIIFSTFLLVAYLISLVSGSAHQSSTKSSSSPYEEDSSTRNKESQSESTSEVSLTKKQRETLAVLVWMCLFAVCILQLLVAGGTLGGTYERDGRKTIRNCKIWMVTTCFLVILLVIQLTCVFIFGNVQTHYVSIIMLSSEIAFRSAGLIIVSRFIKELSFEFAGDDELDLGDRIFYEKLCPSPNAIMETHNV